MESLEKKTAVKFMLRFIKCIKNKHAREKRFHSLLLERRIHYMLKEMRGSDVDISKDTEIFNRDMSDKKAHEPWQPYCDVHKTEMRYVNSDEYRGEWYAVFVCPYPGCGNSKERLE